MASTKRRWLLALMPVLGALTFACTAEQEPATGAPTSTTTATSITEPPDPAIILSQLTLVYEVNIGVCPPSAPSADAACAATLTGAGKIADAMANIVDENPGITNGEKIATAAGDLAESVDTITKTGCYGMGTPAAAPDVLAELCGTLAQSVQLQWMALSSAADGL